VTAALYDEAAEVALLGAVVVRNAALDDVIEIVGQEDFGRQHHGYVFRAMLNLHAKSQPIDPITLSAQLATDGALESVGKPFVYSLGSGVPTSVNAGSYANVVRDKSLLRKLRETARQTLAEAEATDAVGLDVLQDAEQALYRLSQSAIKGDWVSGSELSAELFPVLESLEQNQGAVTGLATGFEDLDFMTRGFQAGDLILVGARPSMGKTAFGLQVAMKAAQSVPVAFLSVEMARQPLALRGVISSSQVDGFKLLSGHRLSDVEHRRVSEALVGLGDSTLYIDESPFLNPLHARSKLRRLASRVGRLGLVVIDYLQLMAPLPEHKAENKTNQVAGISRALKILAREFSTPFLVLAQLNRGLERSSDKRPSMSDLRDSGALEQDADVVLLLHRPEVYNDTDPSLKGLAEVIVGKQRNGPTGTVRLTWRAPQMRFDNYAR